MNFERVLQEHHSDLRQCLSLQELIPLLRKHELLTKEEWEEISFKQTHQKKIDYLVQLLPRKGEHSYEKFITCLESEKEHPSHMELAVKMKETATGLPSQKPMMIPVITNEGSSMDIVVEQMTEGFKSDLNKYIQSLKDIITSLKEQLQEKDKFIAHIQNIGYHASAEVVKFQKLFEYANGPHGSQLHLDINTQVMAKHYRDTRNILRSVKTYLKQDADYIHRNLDAASEESDYTQSRESSMDSQFGRPIYKFPIPCSALSSQELQESNMKESSISASSAFVTDKEHSEPDQEEQSVLQTNTALLKSGRIQTISQPSESDSDPQIKQQFSKELDHGQEDTVDDPLPEVDICANTENYPSNDLEISLDHEESTCSVYSGYLHKEGNGEIPRRRYFTLTKEFLIYSKSEQDSMPLGMIPLIDLQLERKKKTTFEVRALLIKAKKPSKKNVKCYRAIRLKASSEAEMMTWINSIEDAIAELRTQYHT